MAVFNLPNLLYCILVNYIKVPKEVIRRQIKLIRGHSDKFERLKEIGDYFCEDSRTPREYTEQIIFQEQGWQLMCYMLLVIFMVAVVLIFAGYYRKAFAYIAASIFVILCGYAINFFGWDNDRYRFCQAMMVTFLGIWIVRRLDRKRIFINKDIIYILTIGTMIMIMIMDYKLWLFDDAVYNNSIKQLMETLNAIAF